MSLSVDGSGFIWTYDPISYSIYGPILWNYMYMNEIRVASCSVYNTHVWSNTLPIYT